MTSDDSSSPPNAYGGQSAGDLPEQPPTATTGEAPAQPTATYPGQPAPAQPGWNPVTGMTGWDPRVGPPGWAPQQPYSPPPPPVIQQGIRGLSPFGMPARHSWEIPLLVIVIVATVLAYLFALLLLLSGVSGQIVLVLVFAPLLVYLGRGMNYAAQRVNGVKMSPTQFPEGFRMVQEAAARFGMATVPDAYVVTGNGQINAFASGHGFRRYVVVYSDLFEISGAARNPEALAFIIGHEVGHIAAGHVSYWRQLGMFLAPFLPILGNSLIRSQEYTADNHGFCNRPQGAATAMQTLAAGKYLNNLVGFDEMADRAPQEKGFFVWIVNAMASHPVLTWRMSALRDRSRHGKLFWRPDAPQRPPVPGPYAGQQPPGGYGGPPPRYGETATYHEYRPH
ncbi:M48 family metallopeptidase [Nocardia tengchongensis]